MSPGEAIGVGSVSGLGVLGLGTLFIRHLVTRWLEGVDAIPGKLDEVRDEVSDEINKLRAELDKQREHVDTSIDGVRLHTDTEFGRMISSGHTLREKVNLEIGVLTNRVAVAERGIDELKGEVKDFREDLHRVDSNVILIASKLNVTPLMPGGRQ